jgi:hypothetical protein
MQELRCKRSLLLSNGLECWQLFLLLFLKSRFRVECASLTVSPENYVFILFRVEDRAGIPDDALPSMLEASTVIGRPYAQKDLLLFKLTVKFVTVIQLKESSAGCV